MSDYHHDALNMYRKRNIRLMDENKALREMCVRLYRFIDHECVSDHIWCDNCSLLGEGSPCDLTKIKETLHEMGAEV